MCLTNPVWRTSCPVFELTVLAEAVRAYWLERTDNVLTPNWQFVSGLTNVAEPTTLSDPAPADGQRFYRVVTAPSN